jgi:hypothetical protein
MTERKRPTTQVDGLAYIDERDNRSIREKALLLIL